MAKGHSLGKMEINTLEIGKIIENMVKVFINCWMGSFIRECGQTIRLMVMESITWRMDRNT